jgi:hypothetical protein
MVNPWKIGIVALVLAPSASYAQTESRVATVRTPRRYQNIEIMARAAASSDREAVRSLTHVVVVCPHFFASPVSLDGSLENKLSDAELNYRNKGIPGVSEAAIVDLLNHISDKLGVPLYLRTTVAQVRHLRMRLALESPAFMGSGLSSERLEKGRTINASMSPLQAAHLLAVMIDQKVGNPDYQDPTVDLSKSEAVRAAFLRRNSLAAGNTSKHLVMATSNPKRAEVHNAIARGINSLSLDDSYELIRGTLKTLGVK